MADDVVDKFKALPQDRQRALLSKMSPEQKQKLRSAIQARAAKQSKPAPAAPEESTATKVGRGAALGAFEGLGVKPSTSSREVLTGTAKQFGQGANQLVEQGFQSAESIPGIRSIPNQAVKDVVAAPFAAASIPANLVENIASNLESGIKKTSDAIKSKDWEQAAESATSSAVQIATLKTAKEAASEFDPAVLTKDATQKAIQKVVHDRALRVQDHLQQVEDRVNNERIQTWQNLENKVDSSGKKIDLSTIGRKTQESVAEKVKVPQKVPQTVSDIQKTEELPKVFGDRLDPTNPSHAALIQRLRDSGALPETEQASFGKVRQYRSKLGRELQSGTLSGEAKAAGWELYGDLTDAMRKAAEDAGAPGMFEDANRLHQEWMNNWGEDTVLGKAIRGKNASDVLSDLSSPKHAEEIRRVMDKHKDYGLDPDMVGREGQIFQKLGSGSPNQLPFSRWEAMTYGLRPEAGPLFTASRTAYNLAMRDKALREVQTPNPIAVKAQAIKAASEKLGPKASVREIVEEANKYANTQ